MDVRCERCRAQYVFDDDQVTPAGLTVQCTNCGHVFRVKKKELVVTVPVRPEDVTEQPVLADSAALRPQPRADAADAPRQRWTIRQRGGGTLDFEELTTLQRWIVERKVARDDEVSQGDGAWVRLGTLGELQSFFEVVDAAERGRQGPPQGRPGRTDFYPPPPFPPAGFPPPPGLQPPPPQVPAAAPAQRARPSPDPALLTTELAPEELAAVRGRKGDRTRLAVAALLLVTAGAAAYVFGPAVLGRGAPPAAPPAQATPPAPPPSAPPPPEPVSVAVPLTIELKEPPAGPAEPATATAPPKAAEPPAPAAEAAPPPAEAPRPTGPRAVLAQARKARDAGETDRALDLYGKVLSAQPDNLDALTGRGLCYFELGQYAPAEASFKRALQLDLDHPDAIMGLAETYRQQGRKTEALGLFERYLAVHPDGEEAAVARYAISQLKE